MFSHFRTLSIALSFVALSQAIALPQTPPSTSASAPQATVVHQFPIGTWVENLAIRKDGGILASILSSPELVYLDPADNFQVPQTIATFPAPATGALGIAEMEPDVFYVAANSYNFSVLGPIANGTGSVWRVDMAKYDACEDKGEAVELVACFPDSGMLNGMTSLPENDLLLIADSAVGLVWRLDVRTRAIDVAINSTLTQVNQAAKAAGIGLAANGIHVTDGYAYLTNSGSTSYFRVPIDDKGSATGAGEVLSRGALDVPDDFTIASAPGAYVADGEAQMIRYVSGSGDVRSIASIEGPTAVQFGRTDKVKTLYVSSNGGDMAYLKPPVNVGGTISKIELA